MPAFERAALRHADAAARPRTGRIRVHPNRITAIAHAPRAYALHSVAGMFEEEPTGVIERNVLCHMVAVEREPPTKVIERRRLEGLINDSIPPPVQIRFATPPPQPVEPERRASGSGTRVALQTRSWHLVAAGGAVTLGLALIAMVML